MARLQGDERLEGSRQRVVDAQGHGPGSKAWRDAARGQRGGSLRRAADGGHAGCRTYNPGQYSGEVRDSRHGLRRISFLHFQAVDVACVHRLLADRIAVRPGRIGRLGGRARGRAAAPARGPSAPAALATLEQALVSTPRTPELRFLHGVLLSENGRVRTRPRRPSSPSPASIRTCPSRTTTWACCCPSAASMPRPATRSSRRSAPIPHFAVAHENLGDIYVVLAAQAYRRSIEIDPRHVDRGAQAGTWPASC